MSEVSFMIMLVLAASFGFWLPVLFSIFWREWNAGRRVLHNLLNLGMVLMTVGFVMMVLSFAVPSRFSGQGFTAVMLIVYFGGLFLNSLMAVVSGNLRLQFSLAFCWVLIGMVLAVAGSFSPAGTPPRPTGTGLFLIRFMVFGGVAWLLTVFGVAVRKHVRKREG